jgi:hypothetical protein
VQGATGVIGATGATGPAGATGAGSTTAGVSGSIQINDGAGDLAAITDFIWDSANDELEVPGDIVLDDGGTYTTTLQTVTATANRTISFPDATGTVALVAGSSGNLITNQSGAYAGVANSSVDAATGNVTLGSRFISSLNGAASAPPGAFTGTWFTGGSATTTKPQVVIEPTGTTSTAWSTSGTGLGVNAVSAFAGRLLDLQINGTSEWNFSGTVFGIGEANDIAVGTTTGTKIGTATTQKLGFFGVTPVVQQTELTDELTTITHTAPGTADFAIQDLSLTGYGFVTADEGNTVLSVIANLQARVNELETKLVALGFLADAD